MIPPTRPVRVECRAGARADERPVAVHLADGRREVVEILQQDKSGPDLFAIIKQAGENWDGSEPVRRFD